MDIAKDTAIKDKFVKVSSKGEMQELSRPSLSYWTDAWIRLKKNKQALISLYIIVVLLLFTIVGPFVWTIDPHAQDLSRTSETPTLGNKALVIAGELDFEEKFDPNIEAYPEEEIELSPPKILKINGTANTQSITLEWLPVEGASGYTLYRSQVEPQSMNDLGIPIGDIDGGNRFNYQDTFNLENVTYYYAIVSKNDFSTSEQFAVLKVTPVQALYLEDAQTIKPDANVGDIIRLQSAPFGTDYLGRDMLARMMEGARVSLFIAFVAPLLYILLGVIIGGISGFYGGKVDDAVMRVTDVVMALPFLLVAILFRVAFGIGAGESGIFPLIVALVVLRWTTAARLIRGQVLQLRESEFVQASKLLGAHAKYIIFRHLVPNTLGVILISWTFAIPFAIFTEAFLSFIGMGVAPPTAAWGSMCNEGIKRFLTYPHEFWIPAVFISITVLAFNLFGDGLRDALDPKLRST